MAKNCYGRRLFEVLQEQQDPFLLHDGAIEAVPCCSVAEACGRRLLGLCDHGSVRTRRGISNSNAGRSALGRVFCGRTVRRALRRWDLASCFSCGARESFRRLPRAGDIGDCDVVIDFDGDDDSARHGRQLSPVSVLELRHDEESPMLSNWEEEDKPSTSGSSPPSDQDFMGATSPCFTFYSDDKICAMGVGDKQKVMRSGKAMEEQMIMSSWERIAGDISKIPMLVELDFSSSVQEWRRLREEEVSLVGAIIEAMIFEEIRGEAARDMLS